MSAQRLVTAEELEKVPSDDNRYERVQGRVVPMRPVGYSHGRTVIRLGALLDHHVRNHGLGVGLTEVGFKLTTNPDTVRAPDLAFIRQDRIPSTEPPGLWDGPPDLAIGVLSPDDRAADLQEETAEYLAHSIPLVVAVDPRRQTVTLWREQPFLVLDAERELDLGDVVAGFRCAVSEIFA